LPEYIVIAAFDKEKSLYRPAPIDYFNSGKFMIKDFIPNETVTAFLSVRKKDIREYGNGQFITFEFGDASGRIAGVWWEPDRYALEELKEGDVVKARGVIGDYKGSPQLKISRMRAAKEEEYDLAQILPRSKYSDDELKARVNFLVGKIENGYIKKLTDNLLTDSAYVDAYFKAAAGKLWHHACLGGLAEHSANVTEICLDMAKRYSFLDRDLLIFGGLFHDMGKISQYAITSFIDYSDEGRLIGHICWADHIVAQKAGEIENFPPKLLMKLRHLIISHQGMLEYASPIVPQIPEAFVLFYADEIDSKMGAIERIRDKTGPGWSEYVKLLDRFLYFGETE
jgi:3'-5' exoribonuclease